MKFELNTRNMVFLSLFAGLQLILELLTQIAPQMPQGGNVAFSLIVIFLCSYLMSYKFALLLSMVCLLMHFVLGFSTYYGLASFVFDYLLAMSVIAFSSLIPSIKYKNTILPIGIIVTMILKTCCHLLAGWIAWSTPLVGNLTYNLPYNIATMLICFILFTLLYPKLNKIFNTD